MQKPNMPCPLIFFMYCDIISCSYMQWTNLRIMFQVHEDRRIVGQVFEPAQIQMVPHAIVLQNVRSQLSSAQLRTPEPYMWIDINGTNNHVSEIRNSQGDSVNSLINVRYRDSLSSQMTVPAFFAALPYNTTTGTMRYYIICATTPL